MFVTVSLERPICWASAASSHYRCKMVLTKHAATILWAPNEWETPENLILKHYPPLCYLYLFVSKPDILIGTEDANAQLQFSFWKLRKLLTKEVRFSSWSSEVGRSCVATSARNCPEYGRTPELVSGAGWEMNESLIFFQSHPSCKSSILHRQVSYF